MTTVDHRVRRTTPGLRLLFGGGVLLTGYAAWLAASYGTAARSYYVSEFAQIGAYLAGGLLAGVMRPGLRIGMRMVWVGVVLAAVAPVGFGVTAGRAPVTVTQTIAVVLVGLQLPVVTHALLSYPSGVLTDRPARLIVRIVYWYGAAAGLGWLLTWQPPSGERCPGCAYIVGYTGAPAELASLVDAVNWLGFIGLIVVATGVFLWRLYRAAPRERRILVIPAIPMMTTAALTAVWLLLHVFVAPTHNAGTLQILQAATYANVVAVPVSFVLGLLRERLDQARVSDLVRELATVRMDRLRPVLARTLADPALAIAFPGPGGPIDTEGRPISLPDGTGRRRVAPVGDPRNPTAWLIHDASLLGEPELLASVATATQLTLEQARLQAQVRAQLVEVRASRVRIIEATDAARRRLERDLHDGAQQRLFSLGLLLGLIRQRVADGDPELGQLVFDARAELTAALTELRDLARGIHPAVLTHEGLAAAVEQLCLRHPTPVSLRLATLPRLPEAVESTAYFVTAEALVNVAKHADASHAEVSVELRDRHLRIVVSDDGVGGAQRAPGSGLAGLADRVLALDGSLTVQDRADGGTVLTAELPCA